MHIVNSEGFLIHKAAFDKRQWQLLIQTMLNAVGCAGYSVELTLLGDFEMAELNLTSMGCQGATNVLSFPSNSKGCASLQSSGKSMSLQPDKTTPAKMLGWLAFGVDTAKREAFLYGQDLQEHSINLLAHGLAHLLGYDHGVAMDAVAQKMAEAALGCLGQTLCSDQT